MESVVLRVRLISGDSMDVTYEERDSGSEDEVIDHVVSTLADDSGALRCRHGDRLLVLYARGVAAVESHRAARSCRAPLSEGDALL